MRCVTAECRTCADTVVTLRSQSDDSIYTRINIYNIDIAHRHAVRAVIIFFVSLAHFRFRCDV